MTDHTPNSNPPHPALTEPLLVDINSLCSLLKLSRAKIYSMLSSGKIGPMPIKAFGKRTLFDADEVRRWVQAGRCCPREAWLAMEAGR